MALARLALKNLAQRAAVSPSSCYSLLSQCSADGGLGAAQNQRWWGSEFLRGLTKTAGDHEKSAGRDEVAVAEGDKKSRLTPRRQHSRGLWRNNSRDLVPSLQEFLPSGLGNAIQRAAENFNRLLENLAPSRLIGRVKEQEECYKLRYYLPGLRKADLKITVEDGILRIKAEQKEEDDDDEDMSAMIYGLYDAVLVLPEDTKVDEIKAEMKDGVLTITIPRIQTPKKDVKEIPIN